MNTTPPTKQSSQNPTLGQQLVYIYDTIFRPDELLCEKSRMRRMYLFSFFVPFGMMALVYCSIGAWPFVGPNSALVLDMNGQYVYFFANLRNIVFGDNSFLYSWSRSLGGEFMGMYAYYLASPLSWLVLLFPESMITDAIWLMLVIKTGICGLTISVFLQKVYPTRTLNTVLFSTLYAFCAYNLAYMSNIMWMDAVMLLPLLVLGVERLLSDRKYILFTSMLTLIILSNYYIGFMVCIFVALYFVYYHIARGRIAGTHSETERHFFVKSLLRIGVFSAIAVAISAVIILPAYYSLEFGKMNLENSIHQSIALHNFLDVISKMFFGHIDTIRPIGLPYVYSGMITLLTLPIFFASAKIKICEKVGTGLLLMVFIFSMSIPALDILWHGGQSPNWMNFRYSFIFSFLLIVFAYRGFAYIRHISFKFLLMVGGVLGALLILIHFQNYGERHDYVWNFNFDYNVLLVYGSFLIIVILIILMYFYRRALLKPIQNEDENSYKEKDEKNDFSNLGLTKKRAATVCLTLFVLFEAYVAGVLHNASLAMDVVYSTRASYVDFIQATQPSVDYVRQEDDGFYRMEKTFYRMVNDNMSLNMRGVSGSTSTFNLQTLAFLHRMGYRSNTYISWYYGGNPVNDSLLGIRYVIDDDRQHSAEFYDLIYKDEINERFVFENPHALSLAFAAHEDILNIDHTIYDNPFNFLNSLVTAMVGHDADVFHAFTVVLADENYEILFPIDDDEHEHIANNITEEHSDQCLHQYQVTYIGYGTGDFVYMYIPAYLEQNMKIFVNGVRVEINFSPDFASNINPVGRFADEEKYEITLCFEDNEFFYEENLDFFYALDYDVFQSAMEELSQNQLEIAPGFSEDRIAGSVSITEEKPVLFTSIPFDRSWQIYMNGEHIFLDEPLLDALIALELSPGEHEIIFVYRPQELVIGGGISLTGLAVFGGIIGVDLLRKKKSQK